MTSRKVGGRFGPSLSLWRTAEDIFLEREFPSPSRLKGALKGDDDDDDGVDVCFVVADSVCCKVLSIIRMSVCVVDERFACAS